MGAAQNGHELCARALLEADAAVDHVAANGATALIIAAIDGSESCIQLLLDAGADREIEMPGMGNALCFAETMGHSAVSNLLRARDQD